ncbi:uncharacterized protein PFL1_03433 [Pseudozyma flocculosa PF-1]|uniref:Pentacotripeptide-repeat region of PRORP domain-containing protein n=2 Tax=Pseudozyma flocculosa TaxID=84751 RepID=A0A5C3FAV5_9BASI|nr:uncharacterized protein PFL1_03433 [Pseudozyma flocculosa PF-1]EPQ29146.1 hypothetical protein PFL1_03433 [Pseudozyma flocculosa PF-1]SPO41558.1 uncharacterized protein PSFLO_07040 [Pseudozyma flocculosa]
MRRAASSSSVARAKRPASSSTHTALAPSTSRLPSADVKTAAVAPSLPFSTLSSTHVFPAWSATLASALPGSRMASSLAHFFDRNAPKTQPQSLFQHPQRSTDAYARFRGAISARNVSAIASAYQELVDAFHAHRRHLEDVARRWQVRAPIGHSSHDFRIRKADLVTAIRTVLYAPRRSTGIRRLGQHEAQLARRILYGMRDVFGFPFGASDLHHLLWSYCDESPASKSYVDPVEAFRRIRAQHPTWKTSPVDWNLVLKAVCRRKDLDRAEQLVRSMEAECIGLSDQNRNTLASLYYSLGMTDMAEEQLRRIGELEAMPVPSLVVALNGNCMAIRSCDDDGQRQQYVHLAQRYAEALRGRLPPQGPGGPDRLAWLAVLRHEAMVSGADAAVETVRSWTAPDALSPRFTVALLQLHERELEELQTSDEALALLRRIETLDSSGAARADRGCFSLLISSLLGRPPRAKRWTKPSRSGDEWQPSEALTLRNPQGKLPPNPNQIREAQLLYDHVLASGVAPDSTMVMPLVLAYCDAFLPSLPSAMKLMDDVLRHVAPSGGSDDGRKGKGAATEAPEAALDTELFNALLRGCAKVKDVGTARVLLRQMALHDVRIDAESKLQAARVLMRCSSSWKEAFEMYRRVAKLGGRPDQGDVDEDYSAQGYTTLLDDFRKLELRSVEGEGEGGAVGAGGNARGAAKGCAPPEYVLAIVNDMREAGHHPSCATYTSLLDYYAKAVPPSAAGVYATHELLKLDERVEPDLPLINALMNAYNRIGEPGPVVSIWNSLMANRQEVDGATLSVVLDTAGRYGMLRFARQALAAVKRLEAQRWLDRQRRASASSDELEGGVGGAPLATRRAPPLRRRPTAINKGAWDAWIECLCRCGRLEEAVELVFGSMPRQLVRDARDAGIELEHAPDDEREQDLSTSGAAASSSSSPASSPQLRPIRDAYGRIVGPDDKTLRVLLKFAAAQRDRQRAKVHSRAATIAGLFGGGGGGGGTAAGGSDRTGTTAVDDRQAEMTVEEERMGGSAWHEIRARVREEMPWLWDQVKTAGLPGGS